jgi:hypothetical protein
MKRFFCLILSAIFFFILFTRCDKDENDPLDEQSAPDEVDEMAVVDTSETPLKFRVISESEAELINDDSYYKKRMGSVVVPARVLINDKIYVVTSIGDSAFCQKMVFPSGIISIRNYEMWNTGLTDIKMPNTITNIGNKAFCNCDSLESVQMSNAITNIGSYAFGRCLKLTSLSLPSGVTSIGEYAFNSCTSLTNIEIPSGVTSIGEYAFNSCTSLTNIKIPSGITEIGDRTFWGCCNLEIEIDNLKKNVKIGKDTFKGCVSVIFKDIAFSHYSYPETEIALEQGKKYRAYSDDGTILFSFEVVNLLSEEIILLVEKNGIQQEITLSRENNSYLIWTESNGFEAVNTKYARNNAKDVVLCFCDKSQTSNKFMVESPTLNQNIVTNGGKKVLYSVSVNPN